jgi:hypothetical protein
MALVTCWDAAVKSASLVPTSTMRSTPESLNSTTAMVLLSRTLFLIRFVDYLEGACVSLPPYPREGGISGIFPGNSSGL